MRACESVQEEFGFARERGQNEKRGARDPRTFGVVTAAACGGDGRGGGFGRPSCLPACVTRKWNEGAPGPEGEARARRVRNARRAPLSSLARAARRHLLSYITRSAAAERAPPASPSEPFLARQHAIQQQQSTRTHATPADYNTERNGSPAGSRWRNRRRPFVAGCAAETGATRRVVANASKQRRRASATPPPPILANTKNLDITPKDKISQKFKQQYLTAS